VEEFEVAIGGGFWVAIGDGPLARLEIVEIPEDVVWEIAECDGLEHVAEAHQTWHGKCQ